MQHHRAEHSVVVRGTARATISDNVTFLHENESTLSGARHRLENPGKIDLELVEVQTGSYFGEDDIARVEDDDHRRVARAGAIRGLHLQLSRELSRSNGHRAMGLRLSRNGSCAAPGAPIMQLASRHRAAIR